MGNMIDVIVYLLVGSTLGVLACTGATALRSIGGGLRLVISPSSPGSSPPTPPTVSRHDPSRCGHRRHRRRNRHSDRRRHQRLVQPRPAEVLSSVDRRHRRRSGRLPTPAKVGRTTKSTTPGAPGRIPPRSATGGPFPVFTIRVLRLPHRSVGTREFRGVAASKCGRRTPCRRAWRIGGQRSPSPWLSWRTVSGR